MSRKNARRRGSENPQRRERCTLYKLYRLSVRFGDRSLNFREALFKLVAHEGHNYVFRAEMICVNEIQSQFLCLQKLIVLQIGGNIGVASGLVSLHHFAAAGPAAACDDLNRLSAINIAQTVGVQALLCACKKIIKVNRRFQPADAADAIRRAVRVSAVRGKQAGHFRAERRHQAVIHTAGGRIHIRVQADGGNAACQHTDDFSADAVIVGDIGVFSLVRERAPQLDIHISTQASAVSAASCNAWYKMGAKRVVLARELTFREIMDIKRNIPEELELEAFVHGSMCVSYSGRCLLSNYFTGRDANHGVCAQSCRWMYSPVADPAREINLSEANRPDVPVAVAAVEDGGDTFFIDGNACAVLDFGKKYCHESPSIQESLLHDAIMSAVKETAHQSADVLRMLKLHIGMGLDADDSTDESMDIQIRIAEIDAEFKEMLKSISSEISIDNYDDTKMAQLLNEKHSLEQQLRQYEDTKQKRLNAKSRLEEIFDIIDGLKNHPMSYDDKIIRQILECVVVESKERIKVVFIGGMEVIKELG